MSKLYTITLDGEIYATRSAKDSAINVAATAIAKREGYRAQVLTPAGNVVHTVARRKITVHTKPYTKVVELAPEVAALVPAGYVAAYERPQNGTVVLRKEDDELVEDPALYAVLDAVAKSIAGYAGTTREAGQIMKRLGKAKARVTA